MSGCDTVPAEYIYSVLLDRFRGGVTARAGGAVVGYSMQGNQKRALILSLRGASATKQSPAWTEVGIASSPFGLVAMTPPRKAAEYQVPSVYSADSVGAVWHG